MYDELIKKIRHCATDPMHCLSCGEVKDGRCFKRLMTQAADAIEDLSKDRDKWKATAQEERDAYRHWFDQYQKDVPRWIPVTERLPEMRTWEDDGLRCSSSVLFRTDRTIHIGYVIEDSYNDEYAGEVKLHRWYMQGGYRIENVTHWMPLPKGPEEERHEKE